METFAVPARGIGKPDYTKEVSSARERAGIYLKVSQQIVAFGVTLTDMVAHPTAIPWVQPPIAPGAQSHYYDLSTGLPAPYNLAAGYTLTLIQEEHTNNQDIEIWLYMDGLLVACPGISPSGGNVYFNIVVPFSTTLLDPTALSAHTFDVIIVNKGGADLEGGFDITCILEAVGTLPWPTTKNCRCPFCGHIQTVPVGTTKITCEKCRKPYLVYDFSRIKEL